MLVHCIGAEGYTNQIDRIRQGFTQISETKLTDNISEADLIYVNNPWFDHVLKPGIRKPGSKLIVNILDIPEHLFPDYPLTKLVGQLTLADAVTCISKTVAKQILKYTGINASVIYNPAKDVYFTGKKTCDYKYAYIGRACDANKRFSLVTKTMILLGEPSASLVVCGSEYPGFGYYVGVVPDSALIHVYNSVDFVFLPSKFEGIGLSMIEGSICGAIPIVTNDNKTAKEFFPDGRYDEVDPAPESIAAFIKKFDNLDFKKQFKKEILNIGQTDFKKRFDKVQVATNILNVYKTL
jgi:glycosyltransferase involved in cell wall biosynthesis